MTNIIEKIKMFFKDKPEPEPKYEAIIEPEQPVQKIEVSVQPDKAQVALLREILAELKIANDLELVDRPISDPRRAILILGREQ